ncbi:MAG: hypothetical protein IKC07_00145, partial [Clostridia bacterium]|nr:hypothetical protein [Clostridia bacterium]
MRKFVTVFMVVFTLLSQITFAEVITTEKTEGYGDYIYVAGESDNYPIEYYDEDLKAYQGIIPELLEKISKNSGIDFVYINGNKEDKNMLGENLQADIISSVNDGEELSYKKDYLELVSYKNNGEMIKYGIVFTSLLNDEKIADIKSAANKISVDEKNGIYLSYASESTKPDYIWIVIALAFSLLLIGLIVFLCIRIKKMRDENEYDKITDIETGMGNLRFFKHHFRYSISDMSRSLYYVAYIILDSSYLRSYHGDSSFEDMLKYTAYVLSEYTGDREMSARIT